MKYLGDYPEDQDIRFFFNTCDSDGAAITYTGGTIKVYKDGSDTEDTATVTPVVDFDGIVGVHEVVLAASTNAFYTTGSDYLVVLDGATVDGNTVRAAIALCSIENRSNTLLATSAAQANQALEATLTAIKGGTWNPATDSLDEIIDAITGVTTVGAGAIEHTITISDDGGVVDGAEVWITTGTDPTTGIVAGTLVTDAMGDVTFMLDAGNYYSHAQKSGVNFTSVSPASFTVA